MSVRNCVLGAVLATALAGSGCAPATKNGGGESSYINDSATMVVENNNWHDMTVYLVRNGTRSRLGSVPSMGRANFVLGPGLIGGSGEIRLLADPLGSTRKFLSEPILVFPGRQVRFKVENNLAISSYMVH